MDQKTEAEIIDKVLKGERQAYALLIDEYKSPVYNLAYRMTGNSEDADDLTQETFIRAYKYLWRYDPQRKFFTWLYTISFNLIKNHLKRNKASMRHTAEIKILSSEKNHPSPEAKIIEDQEISFCLLTLDYKLRGLLLMKYQQELSFEEIAEVTGKPVSSIKMNIYRGLKKIKESMNK
jgi:RNA polymerase sigma-70 factor, ECF subfamily